MPGDPRAYLWDVREAGSLIEQFVQGIDFDAFAASALLRSAVERQFEIAGEALPQLSKVDAELAARVPELRRVVAFRNPLMHGYAALLSHQGQRLCNAAKPRPPHLTSHCHHAACRIATANPRCTAGRAIIN